jgi:hypothetical protein
MNYTNTHVRYERGDKVTPVRITKQWVNFGKEKPTRKFISTRCTVVGFGAVNHGPDEWTSSKAPPVNRDELIRQGLIRRPSYESLPCLELDDPATWNPAVADKGPPWADSYEFGTDAG